MNNRDANGPKSSLLPLGLVCSICLGLAAAAMSDAVIIAFYSAECLALFVVVAVGRFWTKLDGMSQGRRRFLSALLIASPWFCLAATFTFFAVVLKHGSNR